MVGHTSQKANAHNIMFGSNGILSARECDLCKMVKPTLEPPSSQKIN